MNRNSALAAAAVILGLLVTISVAPFTALVVGICIIILGLAILV